MAVRQQQQVERLTVTVEVVVAPVVGTDTVEAEAEALADIPVMVVTVEEMEVRLAPILDTVFKVTVVVVGVVEPVDPAPSAHLEYIGGAVGVAELVY
jgi:hypothetical protein